MRGNITHLALLVVLQVWAKTTLIQGHKWRMAAVSMARQYVPWFVVMLTVYGRLLAQRVELQIFRQNDAR